MSPGIIIYRINEYLRKKKTGVVVYATWMLLCCIGYGGFVLAEQTQQITAAAGYSGTQSCRECHEKFYLLWSPSHHGKAMQPFTADLTQAHLIPQEMDISIGQYRYRADIDNGVVKESGPDGEKQYTIEHAMGGKNVYYFLTSMDRGRLQTLPVAYDVRKKKWFDMAQSGIRHFPVGQGNSEPVHWKDWQYTFNTACYRCHVSQLSTNYDLNTDTYHTVWAEPGINCETCHGPGDEHVRLSKAIPKGTVPADWKIIRGGRSFSVEQNNDTCNTCHAKMVPLTEGFMPGDRFFDHYDLGLLENPDYYPDGRDLGENYTMTSWLLSPCVKSGNLSCLHCHTSSGRFRQQEDPNQACMPCHAEKVENPTAHAFHPDGAPGSQCIACHMPKTEFARMIRSDHSMLPPTPTATVAFESPNACNLCHNEQVAAWADVWVRKWRQRDYQEPIVYRAGLIEAARKNDWSRLQEMLAYIQSKDRDSVFVASLIRLLRACPNPSVWSAVMEATKDPSPLVRSSAVESLGQIPSRKVGQVLLAAAADDVRLVRIKAAAALASHPRFAMSDEQRANLDRATREFLTSIMIYPDQWTAHYNLGNYLSNIGDLASAITAYKIALKLEPRAVPALVNMAMAYAGAGENTLAENSLNTALNISPDSAVANFNMGLLKAEQHNNAEAEIYLRTALAADPQMHVAAYNLGILMATDRLEESINLLFKAFELQPNPKYAFTLAYYLNQNQDLDGAARTLEFSIWHWPNHVDAHMLLTEILINQGRREKALRLLRDALSNHGLSSQDRYRLTAQLKALENAGIQSQ